MPPNVTRGSAAVAPAVTIAGRWIASGLTLPNARGRFQVRLVLRDRNPVRKCAHMNAWPFVASAVGACAGVASWAAVSPTSQLFGRTLHHTSDASQIALTFDDGPNPACTPELLKLLERHHASATFFLVGRFARAYP
jgi:hypothetical protein